MSDHVEEQEMEAEALTAIFDTAFEVTKSDVPFEWSVRLYPVDTHDEVERDEVNHVACKLKVEVPSDYPDVLPVMDVEILKVSTRMRTYYLLRLCFTISFIKITTGIWDQRIYLIFIFCTFHYSIYIHCHK